MHVSEIIYILRIQYEINHQFVCGDEYLKYGTMTVIRYYYYMGVISKITDGWNVRNLSELPEPEVCDEKAQTEPFELPRASVQNRLPSS